MLRRKPWGNTSLTLIPTKDCYVKTQKNICDLFINCSDKACFSGVAIYTNPLNGRLVRVNRYIDGVKMQGVLYRVIWKPLDSE